MRKREPAHGSIYANRYKEERDANEWEEWGALHPAIRYPFNAPAFCGPEENGVEVNSRVCTPGS